MITTFDSLETFVSRYWGGFLFWGFKSKVLGTERLVKNVSNKINRMVKWPNLTKCRSRKRSCGKVAKFRLIFKRLQGDEQTALEIKTKSFAALMTDGTFLFSALDP